MTDLMSNPLAISIGTNVSYLVLYTAYSKKTKTLQLGLLTDVLFVGKSLDHTLVEWNKVISLSGLTVLTLAYCPGLEAERWELLWHAMLMLWTHSVYSAFKFYGGNNLPHLSTWGSAISELLSNSPKVRAVGIKKLAITVGVAGQAALSLGYWGYITPLQLCLAGVGLGTAHFYLMEIDYKIALQVRPYAYLPFPLAALGLYYGAKTLA